MYWLILIATGNFFVGLAVMLACRLRTSCREDMDETYADSPTLYWLTLSLCAVVWPYMAWGAAVDTWNDWRLRRKLASLERRLDQLEKDLQRRAGGK